MKVLEKAKDSLVFYYKVILMLFLVPTLLVPCVAYCYKLMFIMLGVGALGLLYDLFTTRKFLKARGMFWLIGFLIVFALSVAINYKTALNLNAASLGYTAVALLLLYPDSFDKTKDRALFELSVLNNIFIGMTTVLSTISIGMFICLYHKSVIYADQTYVMGWSQNRLFGLYSNTGYMMTALALAITVFQIAIMKARGKKINFLYAFFLIYTSIFNFASMCLENAKGAFISLFAFVAIGVFFCVAKALSKKNYSAVKAFVASALAVVLSVGALYGTITVSRKAFSYLPSIYRSLGGAFYNGDRSAVYNLETGEIIQNDSTSSNGYGQEVISGEGDKIMSVEIDRNIPESYGFLTGRTVIWKFGINQFLEKPIFGYGPQSHRSHFIVDNYLRHFHNLIIQTLVSVGTVGSVFIFAFFAVMIFLLAKNLFIRLKKDDKYFYVFVWLVALLGMFGVNSMAEVTILFITRFSMFIFWMYIGYAQVFTEDINLKTDKITAAIESFIKNIFDKLTKKPREKNEK